ncbi:DJ-1/PfpI family protein [Cystobacter ferrugineus]|nr:DJ-1/PfpI family protein [Cystobacter ferrugineus]
MNRRDFGKTLGTLLTASTLTGGLEGLAATPKATRGGRDSPPPPSGTRLRIAMLIYPGMTAQDMIGPQLLFSSLGNVDVHLVWKTREAVVSDTGVSILPTATLQECPRNLDILFVGGGLSGTWALMNDLEILGFLEDRGHRARYVTSVCTGSLVLGAAGLLRGYEAASYWAVRNLLPLLGARPVARRIVEDRNRITGGGVTAGLDFGLYLSARLRGETFARMQQLSIEYDPQPPFQAGSPESAGEAITAQVLEILAPELEAGRQAALEARRRLDER